MPRITNPITKSFYGKRFIRSSLTNVTVTKPVMNSTKIFFVGFNAFRINLPKNILEVNDASTKIIK
jgi:hypothetical protein